MKQKRSLREWLRLHDQAGALALIGIPILVLLIGGLTHSGAVTAGVALLWVMVWGCVMSSRWEKLRCPHCGSLLFKNMNLIKEARVINAGAADWTCRSCGQCVNLDAPIDP